MVAIVRNTKKRMAAAGNRGTMRYPGACRRAVLLPNYSKHSAIGASIKGAFFLRVFLSSSRTHTLLLLTYLLFYLFLSAKALSSRYLEDSHSSDVNFSHERVRARTHRRRSFDHRHREVGITTTGGGGASAILHGGRRCSRIGTVDGRYAGRRDGEVETLRSGRFGTAT